MKTEQTTLYTCDFCSKYYKSKRFAELHEKRCIKNPDNWRGCFTCNHITKKGVFIAVLNHEAHTFLLFCKAKKVCLTPPVYISKQRKTIDYENIEMPKICELYGNEPHLDFEPSELSKEKTEELLNIINNEQPF